MCYLPVYPRWRGEHVIMTRIRQVKRGLSPLARGTPYGVDDVEEQNRFIPAGAGNTNHREGREG